MIQDEMHLFIKKKEKRIQVQYIYIYTWNAIIIISWKTSILPFNFINIRYLDSFKRRFCVSTIAYYYTSHNSYCISHNNKYMYISLSSLNLQHGHAVYNIKYEVFPAVHNVWVVRAAISYIIWRPDEMAKSII